MLAPLAGILLIGVGVLFLLLGFIGLAARVWNELPRTNDAPVDGSGTQKIDLPSTGDLLAAVLTAIAQSPGYAVALVFGVILVLGGLLLLGVQFRWGDNCFGLDCPAPAAGSASPGASPSPAASPSV